MLYFAKYFTSASVNSFSVAADSRTMSSSIRRSSNSCFLLSFRSAHNCRFVATSCARRVFCVVRLLVWLFCWLFTSACGWAQQSSVLYGDEGKYNVLVLCEHSSGDAGGGWESSSPNGPCSILWIIWENEREYSTCEHICKETVCNECSDCYHRSKKQLPLACSLHKLSRRITRFYNKYSTYTLASCSHTMFMLVHHQVWIHVDILTQPQQQLCIMNW